MAIQWSGTSGHLRIGIEVTHTPIGPSSTHTDVHVDYYVQTQGWGYGGDSQSLHIGGSIAHRHDYSLSSGTGETKTVHLYRYIIPGQGLSYSGGPGYHFAGSISGAYDGSSPSIGINWTLPARPASVPTQPSIAPTQVTSTTAHISIGPADGRGAGIDAYQVQVDDDPNWGSPHADAGGGSINVAGLTPARTYYARARAHNAVGWGAWTNTVSFTTGATIPDPPGQVALSGEVGQTDAAISWVAPYTGGSPIQNYTVQVSTDANFSGGWKLYTATSSPFLMTGLEPGTRYWARVRAVNAVGAGNYSASVAFTTLTGTPVILSPTQGQVRGAASAEALIEAFGIALGRSISVQFSKDETFATGVTTATLNPTGRSANNRYTVTNTGAYLDNGQWYARARVTNTTTGYITPWSATVAFTESHTPSASVVGPTAGATIEYAPTTEFSWRFNDAGAPTDYMTAFRLVIENSDTGATVYDSGKTTASGTVDAAVTRTVALAESLKNVLLRWRVQVWDRGDQISPWSGYSLFMLAEAPKITVTSPAPGLTVDNGSPLFAWTTVIPSGGTQVGATVRVYDQETAELIWSADIGGSRQNAQPDVVILRNGKTYTYTITVTDSTGLTGTAGNSFLVSYQAPPSIAYTVNGINLDERGYISVDWPGANPDDAFVTWKVYRRNNLTTGTWELLERIPNQNIRQYRDYMIAAGQNYSYSVTQEATRSGIVLESPVGYYLFGADEEAIETRMFAVDLSQYWLINPDDQEQSILLPNVVSDDVTLEFETATYTIIGRGRHRDEGDELGYTGTLTCQVLTPERTSSFRTRMEELRRSKETYYLRTPFGRLFPVALGDLGWAPRAGTGTMEMGQMTIPYEQVA